MAGFYSWAVGWVICMGTGACFAALGALLGAVLLRTGRTRS
jgi:hypothetical protein